MMIFILRLITFSAEHYIFDENRIKQVFSEYELLEQKNSPEVWLNFLDRENEVRIQISNYRKGDSKKAAQERFNRNAIDDGFKLVKNSRDLSKEILGVSSELYVHSERTEVRRKTHIFLDKLKVSFVYTGDDKDYEIALKLLKEAIDSNAVIKVRSKKIFNKNYSIDNYIDKNRLIANAKTNFKNITFHEIPGTVYDWSEYQISFDENQLGTRAVIIRANNNYSKKVILRNWETLRKQYQDPYKFRDEEKKITQKYFGVNARTEVNDYLKRESKLPIIGVQRIIITDNFTIVTMTYEIKGNKKQELIEYEAFLKLVKDSMK